MRVNQLAIGAAYSLTHRGFVARRKENYAADCLRTPRTSCHCTVTLARLPRQRQMVDAIPRRRRTVFLSVAGSNECRPVGNAYLAATRRSYLSSVFSMIFRRFGAW